MEPRIVELKSKYLVGKRQSMSLMNNKTAQLWGSFSPYIDEIKNKLTSDKISMQVYGDAYHSNFSPHTEFEKWAAVEVANFEEIPNHMECFTLSSGSYAVFDYKGSSQDSSIFEYIFRSWLPNSKYHLDKRPHFEVLGENYKNNDPDSEEEIWIPIKQK